MMDEVEVERGRGDVDVEMGVEEGEVESGR